MEKENKQKEQKLMGFVRKTKTGNALAISVSTDAFKNAQKYETKDGKKYVNMIIRLANLQQVINGQKSVTNLIQFSD